MDESATDYRGYEFDCQADYTQFLEEARKYSNQECPNNLQETGKQLLDWDKKKKSWKTSLFSWLKNDKKSKSIKEYSTHVSGPVEAAVGGRAQRAASGPLIGILGSTRSPEEYEVPYMCLGQLNNPQKLQSYGPLYLVT